MYKIITIVLICLIGYSCRQSTPKSKEIIEFNVDIGDLSMPDFNDLVSDVTCMRLTASRNNFFHDIWKTIYYNGYLYIYSLTDLSVYIFDQQGILIKRLDEGKGHVEMPTDMIIDEKTGRLMILDTREKIKTYDLCGAFLDELNLGFHAVKFEQLNDGRYIFYDGRFDEKTDYNITITEIPKQGSIDQFIPKRKDLRKNARQPATLFAKNNTSGVVYSIYDFNDTIYMSDPQNSKTFIPKYHLDFNGYFFTDNMYPPQGFTDSEGAKFIAEKKYIRDVHSFYVASNKLFFRLAGKYEHYCSIDLLTDSLVVFDKLFDQIKFSAGATSIHGTTGNQLIMAIPGQKLSEHYKTAKVVPTYSSIKKVLDEIDSPNDWVIMFIGIK